MQENALDLPYLREINSENAMGAELPHWVSSFTVGDCDVGQIALLPEPCLGFPKSQSLFLEGEMRGGFLSNEVTSYPKSYICLCPLMLPADSCAPCRLLESWPPFTTIFHEYPGPANYHRGVWFLWNAQGLLPLPARWLETWDSGDVWPTQGQRKGKKEKQKVCIELVDLLHWGLWTDSETTTFLLGLWPQSSFFLPGFNMESSPGLRCDLKRWRSFLSFWDVAGISGGSHESKAVLAEYLLYCPNWRRSTAGQVPAGCLAPPAGNTRAF